MFELSRLREETGWRSLKRIRPTSMGWLAPDQNKKTNAGCAWFSVSSLMVAVLYAYIRISSVYINSTAESPNCFYGGQLSEQSFFSLPPPGCRTQPTRFHRCFCPASTTGSTALLRRTYECITFPYGGYLQCARFSPRENKKYVSNACTGYRRVPLRHRRGPLVACVERTSGCVRWGAIISSVARIQ